MVAIKAGDVDRALQRINPAILVLLFYGPDAGLVAERARRAADASVADPLDPFQLIRLDGDVIAADPARLSDEASTMGLFGARRSLWVKPTSRNLGPAVERLLQSLAQDTLVVVEAGDLRRSAPLVNVCERSPKAMAMPCYADSPDDLARVVDATLAAAGLTIDRDARDLLVRSLGGDRLATRGELDKLALYAAGHAAVTVDDVEAIVSDVSSAALNGALDAAFSGQPVQVNDGCRRLAREGVSPSTVLTHGLRHALLLAAASAEIEAGRPLGSVVEAWRGLSFDRKKSVGRHLTLWKTPSLRRIIDRLQATVLDSRRLSDLAEILTVRALLQIAAEAARQGRSRG